MRILYLPNSYSQQRQKEKPSNIYPVLMAMEAEWSRKQGHEVIWGNQTGNYNFVFDYGDHKVLPYDRIIRQPEGLPFLSLPHPDRVFTRAKDYTSGNYKYLPGTHMQVANGCWWGKCTFCCEKGKPYEVRPVDDVISEIEEIRALGFKEVFDDSGTFPIGRWLDAFLCKFNNARKSKEYPRFGCNCRITNYPFDDMYNAGFRMLLFGIESANQETLDKINKGVKSEDIIPTIRKASEAGLSPHIAVMFGYEWETDADAIRTLRLVHYLLRKGFAKTAQASFYTPKAEAILDVSNLHHRKYVKKIYEVAYSPEFWWRQLKTIKNIDDLKYIWKGIKSGIKNYC